MVWDGAVLDRGYRHPNFHRRNDTGLWRGSNDSQKVSVRNWLRALPAGAFLSCSGKKGSKEAGLRGEQLAPARIVPPLRIPREEPSGIDPSLWLGWYVLATAPVLGL